MFGLHHGLPWSFLIDGQVQDFALPFRMQANNGDALAEAAVRLAGPRQSSTGH